MLQSDDDAKNHPIDARLHRQQLVTGGRCRKINNITGTVVRAGDQRQNSRAPCQKRRVEGELEATRGGNTTTNHSISLDVFVGPAAPCRKIQTKSNNRTILMAGRVKNIPSHKKSRGHYHNSTTTIHDARIASRCWRLYAFQCNDSDFTPHVFSNIAFICWLNRC